MFATFIQKDIVVSFVSTDVPRLPRLIPVLPEKFAQSENFPAWPNEMPVEGVPEVVAVLSTTDPAPVVPLGSSRWYTK